MWPSSFRKLARRCATRTLRSSHAASASRLDDAYFRQTTPPELNMKSAFARACTILLFAATAVAAQSSKRAFNPEDWYRIARVGGGALSPDGNTLAFTVTTVIEEKNARHTEVWIQPVAGGVARRMT